MNGGPQSVRILTPELHLGKGSLSRINQMDPKCNVQSVSAFETHEGKGSMKTEQKLMQPEDKEHLEWPEAGRGKEQNLP